MKKDILYTIIGGSGFLGSEICKEMIKKNFKIEILDKDINKYFEEYTNKVLDPFSGAVLAKILILIFIVLFIQKRPRGLFALEGRAVED